MAHLRTNTKSIPIGVLFLTTITVISLMSQDGNGLTPYEDLYNKCLSVSPSNLCDFLFGKKSPSNLTNSTLLSNYSALTYNDKDYGFSIQIPLGWTVGQGDSEFNTVVRFVPAQNDASVDIRIFAKGEYKSIDEYGETFKEAKNEYKLLEYYRNSSTTLSDKPAFKVIYLTTHEPSTIEKTYDYKSFTSKAMMVATIAPERDSIYTLAYFTKPADFDSYLPVVENMIDSFQIYGKGPITHPDNSSSSVP
ncbi:MAG: PsbP-related protein [Nitrososphaerota archaeon]